MNRLQGDQRRSAVLALVFLACGFLAPQISHGVEPAFIPWGDPQYTAGNLNSYPRPAYILSAAADGGYWISTNDTFYGWQPSLGDWLPDLTTNRLLIQLDLAQAPSNLWLSVVGVGDPDAALLANFYDNDLLSIADPMILHVVDTAIFTNRIDLSQSPTASIVALSATNGLIRIFSSALYQDSSRSGATRPTSKTPPPPTKVAMAAKVMPALVTPANPTLPGTTWYVDATIGSDQYDGLYAVPSGQGRGPKKTIAASLFRAAQQGDTISVAAGTYNESVVLNGIGMITTGIGNVILK